MVSVDPLIAAHDVVKGYRTAAGYVPVLAGVHLTVAPREMVAIVGASGVGKSTLLHVLGSLDRPESGRVVVAGQDVFALDEDHLREFRNRTLGFVFQFHHLLPDFDALENVMMPGRIAGLPPREVERRAQALLEEVGLSQRLDFFPSELSGGERQRVAICRALLLEPAILLADEPTGSLDPASAEQVFGLLLDLQRRHRTATLLVTHNQGLASRCARILELRGGVLAPFEPATTEA
jgi:lipoprotein-releasing system ATP-binding protein